MEKINGHSYLHIYYQVQHWNTIEVIYCTAGTFNMPTSYQQSVWEREAHIKWSMVGQLRCESLVLYRIMYGNRVETILKLFLRVVAFVGVMVE